MTTLIEEMRLAVREMWQSIGFGASANTAATVVPALVLGVALNLIALHVVDRVHPIKGKTEVVGLARTELKLVRSVTASMLRQIGGRDLGRCSAERWASSRLAERAHCRFAMSSDRAGESNRKGTALRCGDHRSPMSGRKTFPAS